MLQLEVKKHTKSRKRTVYCFPALASLPPLWIQEITNDKTFSFGDYLTRMTIILEVVFKYLDRKDLDSVKKCNHVWEVIANKELEKRIAPSWLGFCGTCENLYADQDFLYNNATIGIFAYRPRSIQLKGKVCYRDYNDHVEMTFFQYFKKKIIQTNMKLLLLKCAGILCTTNCTVSPNCRGLFQCIILPKIPNIRTSLFSLDATKTITRFKKPNEILRCVLIFTSQNTIECEALYNTFLKGPSNIPVVMGGGLVDHSQIIQTIKSTSERTFSQKRTHCLVFTQEDGVDAEFEVYSLVLDHDINKTEKLLVKCKAKMVLLKHGILFQISCYARHHTKEESALLTKLFPTYQVFNIEVGGEIAWNACNAHVEQEFNFLGSSLEVQLDSSKFIYENKIDSALLIRGMTTVLVLVTWGSKIN